MKKFLEQIQPAQIVFGVLKLIIVIGGITFGLHLAQANDMRQDAAIKEITTLVNQMQLTQAVLLAEAKSFSKDANENRDRIRVLESWRRNQ